MTAIRCYWCRRTLAEFVEKRAIIRCPNERCTRLNVIEGQYDSKVTGLTQEGETSLMKVNGVKLTRTG